VTHCQLCSLSNGDISNDLDGPPQGHQGQGFKVTAFLKSNISKTVRFREVSP